MSLEDFIETLDTVPPELHRNFTLMTDLDRRTKQVMKRINVCIKEYEKADKRSARIEIKKETDELFDKLASFADDKMDLAMLTYDMIDKKIGNLSSLAPEAGADPGAKVFGFDMPLDSNEPTFCNCRGVSHGEMIACDNKECLIEWFHYVCVGLRTAPKGKWYCATCYEQVIKKQRSRSRRRR